MKEKEMAKTQQALDTIETIITRQENAIARIWGSERAKRRKVTGTSNLEQNPELSAIAPHHGTFELDGYKIQRVHCDQLINFYFWRN